ncbi:MAG: family 10 glycosylhydrolase [Acidimicrobiales bacterium]
MLRRPTRAVTIELSQSRLEDIDPARTVEFFAQRSFNTLVVFALGYLHGETYYPSRYAPSRDGLGDRDVFGEFVVEARRAGLGVVAYVNSFFGGPDAWEPHPDWTQRWVDGTETTQGRAKGLCINSPYGERIVSVVGEVAGRYDIDALYLDEPSLQSWCACPNCVARYRADTGRALPLAVSAGDPAFSAFLDWRSRVVAEFVGAAGAAGRAARPGLSMIAQHAFPLASTSDDHFRRLFWGRTSGRRPPQFEGWYRPSFYGQDIRLVADGLDVVAIEPWRRFVGTPAWWVGAAVSYARSAGGHKPVLPLLEYPHFPWGLSRLSDDEFGVACADVVANGGELWWPMYAPGQADTAGWDRIAEVIDALDGARPLDAQEAAETAILVSRRTAERVALDDVDAGYLDHLLGAVLLVRQLHRPYRLLSAEAMDAESLRGCRVLVVPGAAALEDAEADRLRRWVADGGHLVTIGSTATHDADGRWRTDGLLDDVLGVHQLAETVAAGLGYLVGLPVEGRRVLPARTPVRDDQHRLEVRSANVLAEMTPMWDLFTPAPDVVGVPAITRNRFGAGIADHVAPGLGRLRYRFELFEALDVLDALLAHTLLDHGPATIRGRHLGPEVALHCWASGAVRHLFLVNGSSLDTTGRVAVLAEQSVVVPAGTKVRSLRGTGLKIEAFGPDRLVTLDRLADWECLILS